MWKQLYYQLKFKSCNDSPQYLQIYQPHVLLPSSVCLWWGVHCHSGCVDFPVRLVLPRGSSIPTPSHTDYLNTPNALVKHPIMPAVSLSLAYNSAICCYSRSVNYTVIHSGKCQLTVKTATQRKRRGKLKIWLLQLFMRSWGSSHVMSGSSFAFGLKTGAKASVREKQWLNTSMQGVSQKHTPATHAAWMWQSVSVLLWLNTQ